MGYPTEWFTKDSGFEDYLCPICLLVVERAYAGDHEDCGEIQRKIQNLSVFLPMEKNQEGPDEVSVVSLSERLRRKAISCANCGFKAKDEATLVEHWQLKHQRNNRSIVRCATPGCIQIGNVKHQCDGKLDLLKDSFFQHNFTITGLNPIDFISSSSKPIKNAHFENEDLQINFQHDNKTHNRIVYEVSVKSEDKSIVQWVDFVGTTSVSEICFTHCQCSSTHKRVIEIPEGGEITFIIYYSFLS